MEEEWMRTVEEEGWMGSRGGRINGKEGESEMEEEWMGMVQ